MQKLQPLWGPDELSLDPPLVPLVVCYKSKVGITIASFWCKSWAGSGCVTATLLCAKAGLEDGTGASVSDRHPHGQEPWPPTSGGGFGNELIL